jgi:hypothetical protein
MSQAETELEDDCTREVKEKGIVAFYTYTDLKLLTKYSLI